MAFFFGRRYPNARKTTMALQNAATATSIFADLALVVASAREVGQHLFAATTRRVRDVFDSYHPELHYMRGPGPRWREKHGTAARNRQILTFRSE